jgi:hypothetical protein
VVCRFVSAERFTWTGNGRRCPPHLVDDVLPLVPYRQWVITFPWAIRFHLATNPAFLSEMLGAFIRIVFAWQRRCGRALGIRDGLTGSVGAVQRFGGAINCNPHGHFILPDGLFVRSGDALSFAALPPPTDSDIELLATKTATRLTRIAQRHLDAYALDPPHVEPDDALAFASAAEALRPPGVQGQTGDTQYRHLCSRVGGFTLHAGRWVEAHDRAGLERLLRYALRPPFSAERFSLDDDGLVHYQLRKPWPTPEGATEVVLEPLALLRRLAALVPRPYSNLIRYHGILANRSKDRPLLPSPGSDTDGQVPAEQEPRRVPWAQLLRRAMDIDALSCPRCSTPMLVIAFITDHAVLKKILEHLGLPSAPPPLLPARRYWEEIPHEHVIEELDQRQEDIDEQSDASLRSPRSPP